MLRSSLLASLIAVLVLATANPGAAQGQFICDSGFLQDQGCSVNSDCWTCNGGLNNNVACPAGQADCNGICGFSGGSCFDNNDCTENTCLDNEGICEPDPEGSLSFCVGGFSDGQECASDGDCVGQCGWTGPPCRTTADCPLDTCDNAGSCDDSPTCVDTGLPVELSSFVATVDEAAVILSWITASETNNLGFEIEHQQKVETGDADQWATAGFVDGRGTTLSEQSYTFRMEGLAVGTHRFRLKQLDFDGAFEYSDEVEAAVEVPGLYVLERAYPNPFNPTTTIRFSVSSDQLVVATLYDASGKVVRELYRGSAPANESQTIQVDGDGLASGTYHVRLTGENFTTSEQITLVK